MNHLLNQIYHPYIQEFTFNLIEFDSVLAHTIDDIQYFEEQTKFEERR